MSHEKYHIKYGVFTCARIRLQRRRLHDPRVESP